LIHVIKDLIITLRRSHCLKRKKKETRKENCKKKAQMRKKRT